MTYQAELPVIEVWTEGKTDRMHLKAAMQKLGIKLPISFHEDNDAMGHDKLRQRCEAFAERSNPSPIVFVFDRDVQSVVAKMGGNESPYRSLGNNVFSMVIPEPAHRKGFTNIAIEHFYSDEDLCLADRTGLRVYITSEFHEESGNLRTDPTIHVGNKHILKNCTHPTAAKIIDKEVYDADNNNIALSKSAFAQYMLDGTKPFNEADFTAFEPIFEILEQIYKKTSGTRSAFLPDYEALFEVWSGEDEVRQLGHLREMLRNIMVLGLQAFSIMTIRTYEEQIVNETPPYHKKARPIKAVLQDSFFSPTLKSLHRLATVCFHLVDSTAPKSIRDLKSCLEETFELGPLGQVLDDLEKIFPPPRGTAIQTNKAKIRRSLLKFVIPEFTKYDHPLQLFDESAEDYLRYGAIPIGEWQDAIRQLTEKLRPLFELTLQFRTLKEVDPRSGLYTVEIQSFRGHTLEVEEEQLTHEDAEDYQRNYSLILLENDLEIHTFPMLLIKDSMLYSYRQSRASGYEYFSLINSRIHTEPTKKKFNHAIFRTGSKQEFFWTDVVPTINPANNVRANIPREGLEFFVGRTKQKRKIREEVLEIPNQDAIIYGPGGIGKTALMQQITQALYDNSNLEEKLFDNIIWVSAKGDYFDYIFGTIEKQEQSSKSFDEVLTAILEFFEYEDLDEYDFEDKKQLALEVFAENTTLLILDNFETIPEGDGEKIIRFFRVDVKKKLRALPNNFKVVITSRKQIPSGFHPIQLRGLDLTDSRRLMQHLQERYQVPRMLTRDHEKAIHEATHGIPIVIKHCFGQFFEYNQAMQPVLNALTRYKSEIVQFSFKEILAQIEKKDRSRIQLGILLLLEMVGRPLMIRQIAQLLGKDDIDVESALPTISNFQCVRRLDHFGQEKYVLNDEIKMLTMSLSRKYEGECKRLRQRIAASSIEQDFEASSGELESAEVFESYLAEHRLLEAEDFMRKVLIEKPYSVLLNYQYARYLAKHNKYQDAIELLKKVREASNNHPKVLSLLVSCYTSLSIPTYEIAEPYASALEAVAREDDMICLLIAEFFANWSDQIRLRPQLRNDPLAEELRIQRYKEYALKALDYLESLEGDARTAQYFYLCALSYYNTWAYEKALKMIKRAMEKAEMPAIYETTKKRIENKYGYYNLGWYRNLE